jgi:A/G-specific adenine glycosylase
MPSTPTKRHHTKNSAALRTEIKKYYAKFKRDLPWRRNITPYRVVVSEIMLQQTQVARVARTFDPFIRKFPSFAALAKSPTVAVLRQWQGLGYNRRALNLHRLAQIVVKKHHGHLPCTYEELVELPGIGPNTAGSILAFAFDIPRAFIETNIRSVYIHFFFPKTEKREGRKACKKIHDDQLMPFIESTLAGAMKDGAVGTSSKKNLFHNNPREWYYALMDYGVFLKRTLPNPSRHSVHHVHQSKFEGSNRQLRSRILRFVMSGPRTISEIEKEFVDPLHNRVQVAKNIEDLSKEGFIMQKKGGTAEHKYTVV